MHKRHCRTRISYAINHHTQMLYTFTKKIFSPPNMYECSSSCTAWPPLCRTIMTPHFSAFTSTSLVERFIDTRHCHAPLLARSSQQHTHTVREPQTLQYSIHHIHIHTLRLQSQKKSMDEKESTGITPTLPSNKSLFRPSNTTNDFVLLKLYIVKV